MEPDLKVLNKNISSLQKSNPKLAYQLSSYEAGDPQFCKTKTGELNLTRTYEGVTYYYHSSSEAQKEAEEWFQTIENSDAEVIFVYGVGLGYYYEAARKWLKKKSDRAIVFLEEDIGVIYRLLEIDRGTELLRDPQAQLIYFQDLEDDKALFNELTWTYVASPFTISCLKLYQEVNGEFFSILHHKLSFDLVQKRAFVDEYLQYGVPFFRNFYPNLLELPKAFWANGLFAQFEGTPAIICGAGPSLNKNIGQLQNLKDKSLIFAGSSALNALIANGVIPHFGAAVDPNKAQYPRVAATLPHRIPIFYRNRLFNDALKVITGPRLYLTGTGGYDVAEWFDEQLGINGVSLDEGHNIVNFLIEIASALGCNPIVLVGLDLAYTNDQPYATGVVESLNLTAEDFKTDGSFESQPIVKTDIFGKPISTLWKWITEAEWITDFAKNHPEVKLINATEGGLGIKEVPNQTLAETTASFKEDPDLSPRVLREIKQHDLTKITRGQMKELMRTLQESLDRTVLIFDAILSENELLAEQIQEGLPYPPSLESTRISLLHSDLEEEIAYTFILNTFNQVYIRFHSRKILDLQSTKRRITPQKRDLGKIALQKERLTFLKDVARVNRELIERALKEPEVKDKGT